MSFASYWPQKLLAISIACTLGCSRSEPSNPTEAPARRTADGASAVAATRDAEMSPLDREIFVIKTMHQEWIKLAGATNELEKADLVFDALVGRLNDFSATYGTLPPELTELAAQIENRGESNK